MDKLDSYCWGWEVLTQFAQQFATATCRLCHLDTITKPTDFHQLQESYELIIIYSICIALYNSLL